jgi:hypothetical protein
MGIADFIRATSKVVNMKYVNFMTMEDSTRMKIEIKEIEGEVVFARIG